MIVELPNEVWAHVFSLLDFYTLQKIAATVCKRWFQIIRHDCNLSGELTLSSIQNLSGSDINSILVNWKSLKILRTFHFQKLSFKSDEVQDLQDVDFKICKNLEKVILLHDLPLCLERAPIESK